MRSRHWPFDQQHAEQTFHQHNFTGGRIPIHGRTRRPTTRHGEQQDQRGQLEYCSTGRRKDTNSWLELPPAAQSVASYMNSPRLYRRHAGQKRLGCAWGVVSVGE